MAVRLSALRACRPLPPGRFLVLISVRGCVDSRAIVRLAGLGQLKNTMTSSGLEPATFRLIAQRLNQLSYRVPLQSVNKTGQYSYVTFRSVFKSRSGIGTHVPLQYLSALIQHFVMKTCCMPTHKHKREHEN
jgi:hypothetical protein